MGASAAPCARQNGTLACSAFAAVGARAADGVGIAGRNLDYYLRGEFLTLPFEPTAELQRHLVAFVVEPGAGLPFVAVGWPGIIGVVTAQNAGGLALGCLTSPAWSEQPWGTPLPLLYRQIVQHARTLGEAERYLHGARRTIGNNLLVLSAAEGDARVYELTARQVIVRRPVDGTIATTNHFQTADQQPDQAGHVINPSTWSRLARVEELLQRRRWTWRERAPSWRTAPVWTRRSVCGRGC